MPEPCPFCGKPIVREYGSFRCKHCAGSSEDLIDIERKARVAEIRKHARGGADDGPPMAAPIGPSTISSRLRAITAHSGPKPKTKAAPRTDASAPPRPKVSSKPKTSAAKSKTSALKTAKAPAGGPPLPSRAVVESDAKSQSSKGSEASSSKSARLRMVATAHARMAERKKGDAEPAAKVVRKPARKD